MGAGRQNVTLKFFLLDFGKKISGQMKNAFDKLRRLSFDALFQGRTLKI
jgi:hypothetical protein